MNTDGGLRILFRKHLPQVHWTTVESRFTESGIPDLNGCFDGVEFWVECKLARGWKVVIRPSQIAWMSRRIRSGGICFIAARRKTKSADEFWLFHGRDIQILRTHGLQRLTPIVAANGGPTHWPWNDVVAALQQKG
jgi:penicillin-binding protein-related factor A (putative recombinase)